MYIKNNLIKHGLSEIVNASKKEERENLRLKLNQVLKKQKTGAVKTQTIIRIVKEIFGK